MKVEKFYKISGIYMILNLKNGKSYIGSSREIYQRLMKHRYELRRNKHSNAHLQAAYNKYGEENFEYKIIEPVIETELIRREQYWCCTLKPGYNKMIPEINTMEWNTSQREKHSQTMKEYYQENGHNSGKLVKVYDLKGNFLEEYSSITALGKARGINPKRLYAAIERHQYTCYGMQVRIKDSKHPIFTKIPRKKHSKSSMGMLGKKHSPELREVLKKQLDKHRWKSYRISKLSREDVNNMKLLKQQGKHPKDIALQYNISYHYCRKILTGVIKIELFKDEGRILSQTEY